MPTHRFPGKYRERTTRAVVARSPGEKRPAGELIESVARLLWDTDTTTLDLDRHANLVIERVMSRGDWEAMCWLRQRYSKQVLAEFVRAHGPLEGVPVSILSFRYPLVCPLESHPNLPVPIASLEDLVCMKISAIAGRGAAKDFWDLHALLEYGVVGGSLAQALELYSKKFATADVGHTIRSLAYFAEAEASPFPLGLTPQSWTRMKRDFRKAVKEL